MKNWLNLLNKKANEEKIKILTNFNKGEKITRETKIEYLCECGNKHTKTIRNCVEKSFIDKVCQKKINLIKKLYIQAQKDNAKIKQTLEVYSTNIPKGIKNIYIKNRESSLIFLCNCGKPEKKNVRQLLEGSGFFCTLCTNKHNKIKTRNTQIEKLNDKNISLGHHQISSELSPNNIKNPFNFSSESNELFKWKCKNCSHDYDMAANKRVKRNQGCPYCNRSKLCHNNCITCFNKSFASSQFSEYISNNEKKNPRYFPKGAEIKFLFNCPLCKEETQCLLYSIKTNIPCGNCIKWLGEEEIKKVCNNLSLKFKTQVKFNKCKYKRKLSFDFEIILDKTTLLIEYDGVQHFNKTSFPGKDTSNRKIRDMIKNKFILENQKYLLRIAYTDFKMIENIINSTINRINNELYPCIIFSNPFLYKKYFLK